ncbi:MAG: hypothetical protein AAB686_01395 [Patescibacteria group bacterium]
MNTKAIVWLVVAVAVLLGGMIWLSSRNNPSDAPAPLDNFAQCLKDKGATMYGTRTCPYCLQQKKMFGNAFRFINYVECTTEQAKCQVAKVESVPLWTFADGERVVGLQQLKFLAEKTGCELPTN